MQGKVINLTLKAAIWLLCFATFGGRWALGADASVSCLATQVWAKSGAPTGWINPFPEIPEDKEGGTPGGKIRKNAGSAIIIPIQIARIANDDGSRQTHITPAQAQTWIDYANIAYSVANIQFTFDPLTSFATIRSTLVNGMTGIDDVNWDAERKEANHIAASYPGRMCLIARWGPSAGPTGGGFAWWDYNYVTIPGFNDTGLCGEQNIKLFAHEIGHHLGLPHTFWAIFDTVSEASADFATRGNDPNAYDGDGIADTPPHPTINEQACVTPDSFVLNGVTIFNARSNIMSYFYDAVTISTQQVQRVRWVATNYLRNAMQGPSNQGLTNHLEAEDLTVVSSTGVSRSTQGMSGFGADGWSNNQHLFLGFNSGGNITLRVSVPTAGQYRVEFYATQAPDYGMVQCAMDGVNIGSPVDGYAPVVLPSGYVSLGITNLAAGNHNFRLTRTGKNALSTGFLFGADAIRLVNLTNAEPPAIQLQPLSQIVDAGAVVVLHTVTTGSALKYQWLKNALPIPGATNADYVLNPALTNHSANYSVIVSNSLASITSTNAQLTVNAAPISAQWTAGSGVNRLWSNTNNWSPTRVPESHTDVYFDNVAGFTNALGAVSSIVDSSIGIQKLSFDARATNYHGLQLNSGVTLTADFPGTPNTALSVNADSPNTAQEYVTIVGTNAYFSAGNANAPVSQASTVASDPGTGCEVWLRSSAGGNQLATLDMSGLDNFSFGGGFFRVGGNSSASAASAVARGTVLLAKTNFILAGNAYNTALNFGGIVAGFRSAPSLASTDRGEIRLGLMNRFYADYIKIGGNRNCTGMMAFQTSALLANPQLILRNTNGVSRISNVEIGDCSRQTVSANETCFGTIDLSGGTVSALVGNLSVGRSVATAGANQGNGNGVLTWSAGTIDATTLNVGAQTGNNAGSAIGVVNVRSNALLIATTINIGSDAGNNVSGTGNGVLNIDGGSAVVVNLQESNGAGGNGSSTINVTNGGSLNVAGSIIVDTINLSGGMITNGGTMVVQNLRGNGIVRGSVSIAGGGTLSPGASIGMLAISNNLFLAGSSTSVFEADLDTLNCDTVTGINSIAYGGTLVVTNIGGVAARTNGATLKLFNAAVYQNSFTSFSLPPAGTGLAWDTTGLTNGVVRLKTFVSTTPIVINFQLSGNDLNLSWPADHVGWRLECQTNSFTEGLGTNWFTLPGSTLTNQFVVPADVTLGNAFYRLVYP